MKFKLFVFLFIILFFPACPFMGDPPGPILHRDECSEYGCGDGGECKSFDDSDSKTCICDIGYSLYEFDLSEDDSKSYCIAKPKQLVMGTYLKIVLSNYGYDIPKALDEYNRFLYYSDIAKFYPSYNTINDFYLADDYHTIKLLNRELELENKGEIYFDKEIKEIVQKHKDQEDYNIILFTDNTIGVYDKYFSNKFLEFTNGEEIIEISSNSYITENKDFIYYTIERVYNHEKSEFEYLIESEKVEELSPSLGIVNNSCSFLGKDKIKCVESSEINGKIITDLFSFIYPDETILIAQGSWSYTDKNKLYYNDNNVYKFKDNVFIPYGNKDYYGADSHSFCYLNGYSIYCIQKDNMTDF